LYRDILGFEVEYIQDSPADSYSYVAFEIDHKAKHCPDPKRAAIVLEVGDFDYVCERAVAWGLIVHPEERLVTHDGRTGREAGIVDHDGNLVVIYTINEKAG
jgi:hypothetical protein